MSSAEVGRGNRDSIKIVCFCLQRNAMFNSLEAGSDSLGVPEVLQAKLCTEVWDLLRLGFGDGNCMRQFTHRCRLISVKGWLLRIAVGNTSSSDGDDVMQTERTAFSRDPVVHLGGPRKRSYP